VIYLLLIFIIIAALLSSGLYFIAADILKLPTLKASRAVLSAGRQDRKKTGIMESCILKLSSELARFIRIDEYKGRRMAATLKYAGINLTPEAYVARAWVKTGLVLLAVIPVLYIFPLIAPVILFLAIAVYFKEMRGADEFLKKKREAIEAEMPRFAITIEQELKTRCDVLSILDTYRKNAGEGLKHELEITVADMKTGSFEAALARLEARIGSPMLSDVVRGLLSVLRGDNGAAYFQMLARDFKQLEFQRLKQEAMKRPARIRKYSFLMLGCFVLTYLVVMATEIINKLGGMF
jgi:Flp pilus assembly protein TadB